MSSTSPLLDVYKQIPVHPASGHGVWLTDTQGRRFLDFYGGHAVTLLGNGHPRLIQALTQQANTLFFQSNAVDLPVRRRAAERLLNFGPPDLDRVLFVNSGAEANENALRVAFLHTKRPRVVAVQGAFHGRTAGASALTWNSASWYAFPSTPFQVTFVPFDDARALQNAVNEDVAAVIFEPVQGLAGAKVLSEHFVRVARELCTQMKAVLIFDEVQCGMGRTGWPFAAQAFGVTPDILTTAKGLAGGFPAAAVLLQERLAQGIKKGQLGTTFGGGPMGCALIEAVIDVIETERLLPRVRRLSERMKQECRVGPVTDIQGMGFLLGLRTSRPATEVLEELRARSILAGESNDPQVVRLLPALILEDAHVDQLVAALKEISA